MPSSSQPKKSRSTRPKLFQCTGYGDCHMVFTRSEHLARHTRKHTGEKPFKCVVPGCDRMFSRFDNMMQHTQTHQVNRSKVKDDTRKPTTTKKRPDLSIEPISYEPQQQVGGLVSPVSLGSPETIPCVEDENQRRLSVADLCNRTDQKEIHLTQDEFEALQGFGRFRYTPLYYDSLRDLASIACIEPSPDKNTNDA